MIESQKQVLFQNPELIGHQRKFDTAIRDTTTKGFLSRFHSGDYTLDDRLIVEHKDFDKEIEMKDDPSFLAQMFLAVSKAQSSWKYKMQRSKQKNSKTASDLSALAMQTYKIQMEHLLDQNELPNMERAKTDFYSYLSSHSCPRLLHNLLVTSLNLMDIIETSKLVHLKSINAKHSQEVQNEYITTNLRTNSAKINHLPYTFVWSKNMLYIVDPGHSRRFILPRVYLLQLHNKFCDIISVLLLAMYGQGNIYQTDSLSVTMEFISELARMSVKFKNTYYSIAKCLESFVYGELLIRREQWENSDFLFSIVSSLEEETKFSYYSSNLRSIINKADDALLYELGCLSKIMGHPFVNIEKGAAKLYERTNKTLDICPEAVQLMVNYAKKDFISNYIRRHNRWPSVFFNSKSSIILREAWKRDCDPLNPKMPQHLRKEPNIEEYACLELSKNLKFSKLDNFIPYLKDKTITILRSDVFKKYILRNEDEVESTSSSWKETRLLLVYLLNSSLVTDHTKYVDKYNESITLEDLINYLVIKVVPKEKELKIVFRGFGCKTYEDRARCLVQEKNAMHYLDLYSSEQAMTTSELELDQKLHSFRSLHKAYTQHATLYCNIDATAWNNAFRDKTVDHPMKEILDPIFGTTIFGKTHLAYQNTLVYVLDEQGTFSWVGQEGGIEGLNQDTWVVTYLAQIKAALHECGYKYHILCKGDDLRVAFAIPRSILAYESIKDIKDNLLGRISSYMLKVGHTIKLEESYVSEQLFTFNKFASLGGISLPQGFRKIQKCYGSNNAFLETLDDYIASTLSNAHSAAKVLPSPGPAYLVGMFWFYTYLNFSPYYENLADYELIALSMIPSVIGGFPLIYFHNFFVRSESDLLTPFMSLYGHCSTHYPRIAECMKNFMNTPELPPELDISKLCTDIYAVPNFSPMLPSSYLRMMIKPHLKRIVKNERLKELFKAADSLEVKSCMSVLNSAKHLIMKPLQILYKALPLDMIDTFIRKFESGRSIIELMLSTGISHRILKNNLKKVIRQEDYLQKWRVAQLKGRANNRNPRDWSHLVSSICPVESAEKVRAFSWGKPVIGVTMAPMQHLMTYCNETTGIRKDHYLENHFVYYRSPLTTWMNLDRNENWALGTDRPFLGYMTSAGTIAPTVHYVEKDSILSNMKNVIELIEWCNNSHMVNGVLIKSNIEDLVAKILKLYTNTPLRDFAPFSGVRKSGCIDHHLPCHGFLRTITPNCLPNIYTQFSGKSDTHKMAKESQKYKMNLLQIYCHSVAIGSIELNYKKSTTTPVQYWGVTTACRYCSTPIQDQLLIFDQWLIDNLNLPCLSAFQVGSISLDILQESLVEFKRINFRVSTDQDDLDIHLCSSAVVKIYADQYHSGDQIISRESLGHTLKLASKNVLKPLGIIASQTLIRKTELKKSTIEGLTRGLCDMVLNTIKQTLPEDFIMPTIENLANPFVGIITEVPWFRLCRDLELIGRLQDVFNYLVNLTGCQISNTSLNLEAAVVQITYMCMLASVINPQRINEHIFVSDLNNINLPQQLGYFLNNYTVKLISAKHLVHIDPARTGTRHLSLERLIESYDECQDEMGCEAYMAGWTNEEIISFVRSCHFACAVYMFYWNISEYNPEFDHNSITNSQTIPIQDITLGDTGSHTNIDCYDTLKAGLNWKLEVLCRRYDITQNVIERWMEQAVQYEHEHYMITSMLNESRIEMRANPLTIIVTSRSQCINRIRGLDMPEEETVNWDVGGFPAVTAEQRFISIDTRISRSSRMFYASPVTQNVMNYEIYPAQSIEEFTPCYSYLYRPLGMLTGSLNACLQIWDEFYIRKYIAGCNVIAIGTGAGNDVIFLANVYPHSRIWIFTKLEGNRFNHQAILGSIPERRRPSLRYSHLEQGIWDVSRNHTWEYLDRRLKDEHCDKTVHIVWNDIDHKHCEGEYEDILNNTINGYLRHRCSGGILVMKILVTHIATLCGISALRRYCSNVYITRPKSMISCQYLYLVASGSTSTHFDVHRVFNIRDYGTPVNYYGILQKFIETEVYATLAMRHNLREYRTKLEDYTHQLRQVNFQEVINNFPVLFVSLLNSLAGINISNDQINKMLHPARQGRNCPHSYYFDQLNIHYLSIIEDISQQMSCTHHSRIIINTQAGRTRLWRRIVRILGFKFVHDVARSREQMSITQHRIRMKFGDYYDQMPVRDKTIVRPPADPRIIFRKDFEHGGYVRGYFKHFLRGVNAGLSMLAYIHLFNPGFIGIDGVASRDNQTFHIMLNRYNWEMRGHNIVNVHANEEGSEDEFEGSDGEEVLGM
jgi:hypothetical protein